MEFPNLGQHCSDSECKQLDFLPMKCDACGKTFCKDHIQYDTHGCPESYRKDNQVPVCPLCNSPCPVKKGQSPDIVVGQHIDNECQSDPAKQRRKVFTNRCSVKSCKQKELVPVLCENCHKNFCLRHRHEQDHNCKGFQDTGRRVPSAGVAAINRAERNGVLSSQQQSSSQAKASSAPQKTLLTGLGRQLDAERKGRQADTSNADFMPSHLTEEEALRYAVQMSLGNDLGSSNAGMSQQEQEDFMLAQALAASEEEARLQNARRATASRQEKFCQLS
ncbi:AN1-type zinc finger protein 2A-like isoform X1 [Pomacea canaliculata]|uniref:AN1-type zinc finger protein 2A-like isoform X1 n=1 Tax=Pomacea canaliculata TaxID=400727 RepID=UPI000D72C767|nr:AN1-type zinc finger protein 2A-like isoform X1 [Pomacea canaliculata]